MQMNGDDSVAYMFPGKRFRTLQDHFAVNFKTLEQDGLLLHSEGVQGDILTLELRKGRLVLTIGLGRSWNAWGYGWAETLNRSECCMPWMEDR